MVLSSLSKNEHNFNGKVKTYKIRVLLFLFFKWKAQYDLKNQIFQKKTRMVKKQISNANVALSSELLFSFTDCTNLILV